MLVFAVEVCAVGEEFCTGAAVGTEAGVDVVVGAAGICGLSCGGLLGSLGTGVDVELTTGELLAGGGCCGIFWAGGGGVWIGCVGIPLFAGVDVELKVDVLLIDVEVEVEVDVDVDVDVEVVDADVDVDVRLIVEAVFVTCLFTFVHIRP